MNIRHFSRAVAAIALTCAVAACGSGGSSQATPQTVSGTAQSGTRAVSGSIAIKMTNASSSLSSKRSAQYVSSKSKSATLTITPGTGCTNCSPASTQQVSLTSPVCNGGTCTIPFSLLPGAYTGALTFYDGLLNSSGVPTGTVLSQNDAFPMTLVAGASNVIGVVLDGVVANIGAIIGTPSTTYLTSHVVASQNQSIYRIIGKGVTSQYTLIAVDPDGNIITGPGSPTWQTTLSGNTSFVTALSGSALSITSPATQSLASASITVTAGSSTCGDPGAQCTKTLNVGLAQFIAVADQTPNHIEVFPIGASAPLATISTGIHAPASMLFDANGTLYVANASSNTVTIYPYPYTTTNPTTVSTGVNAPSAIVMDGALNLIVAESGNDDVTVYAPPYTGAPTLHGVDEPFALALDPSGNLWIGSNPSPFTDPAVSRVPPPFTGAPDVQLGTFASAPFSGYGLSIDAASHVFVANEQNSIWYRYDPPYTSGPTLTVSSTGSVPLTSPSAITTSADGHVFVGSSTGVDIYSASGSPIVNIGNHAYAVRGFVTDADGAVWYAASDNQPIALVTPFDGSVTEDLLATGSVYNSFLNVSSIAIY